MPAPSFVHLRLHSEYSVADGVVRIDEAVGQAAADGMGALALTDLGNVFGMVKFYRATRKAGIKPILGCDVWLTNDAERDKAHRLLLLVRSREGYLRLCALLSRAWLTNQHRGRAEVHKSWFADGGGDGLIALSGGLQGDVGAALLQDNLDAAQRLCAEWMTYFPGAYYIELQRAGVPGTERYVGNALQLAGALKLPVVATHPVQFLRKSDFRAHEARVCISEGYVLGDRRRPRTFTEEMYFKSQTEMAQLFADLPEALANSVEIAKRCNLTLELGKPCLPLFPTPPGVGLDEHLVAEAERGLAARLERLYPDEAQRAEQLPRYRERLAFEIEIIIQMGFPGYFLIVADFINWAKHHGVPVGPGRGSGAGSLVAYSLRITDLDPLAYNLLFERFLNPERVSMPDFDIDFCQDGRDRVIDYVKNKYGHESVSQIATFGTMAAKAVVRDVGRVLEWGYNRTDELAKLIPFQPGKLITLQMAREMEPRLKEREDSDEETRELLELAGQLEGMTRNVGMHAGGVLIAPGKITDFCPVYSASGGTESVVSQLDKDDVEAIGLVKFDFLGLTTLTILDWAVRYVKRLDPASELVLEKLPLDDVEAYRIFASANTTAVFQFESRGMRDMLKRAQPDRLEDIIALVALYRPGPMDLIPDFIERKHGRQKFEYLDPRQEPILGETYGIMVYQEQVMQMAQVIGGYSLGGADLLRRAMGKKKAEEMAQHRQIFIDGAAKKNVSEAVAGEIFDLMEKFAGYGFNKSHAAAYALVAYHTAYMKAHHPAAFMAANMSAVMDDTDKVQSLYRDAIDNELAVLPPDVNASAYRFEPVDEKTIRYGLGGIKGTGESAVDCIVAARDEGGAFKDLYDFCERIDKRVVNRRAIEALVRAGAFDTINRDRAVMLASVGRALEAAEQRERNAQQVSLFGGADGVDMERPELVAVPAWDERRRLAEEKTALGYFFSGHPFNSVREEVRRFASVSLDRLESLAESGGRSFERGGRTHQVAGLIESVRWQNGRSGRMCIVTLSDDSGVQEIVAYDEVADTYRAALKDDAIVILEVKVRRFERQARSDNHEGASETVTRITAEKILSLSEARRKFARGLQLSLNGEASRAGAAAVNRLKLLLEPYRSNGTCPIAIQYDNGAALARLRLGDDWRVNPEDALVEALGEWLQPENVRFLYA